MTKKSTKQLKSLQGKPLNAPATNYCQMLQEIAEAQRFEVVYTDIPELSAYGRSLRNMPLVQCLWKATFVAEQDISELRAYGR